MKKFVSVILSIILMIGVLTLFFSCAKTSALWQENKEDTRGKEADITEVNGSENDIVFAALDSNGRFIASGSATVAVAYAVVGYAGTVAELTIPATYQDTTINENALPVTKVLTCESDGTSYASYKISRNGAAYSLHYAELAHNTAVKRILFGSNVEYVGACVCMGMTNLEGVSFACTSGVEIGKNAFVACPSLTTVAFACDAQSATIGSGNFTGLTPTYAS